MGPRGGSATGRRLVPGGDGCEPGRGVLEERRPVPCATSRHRAAPSRTRRLPGNCELRSRFPRGAKINNGAALLPAGMIKLLIRSSNYSALLIPLLSRGVNYPARVAVGPGLTQLGALQGTGTWGALGCLHLGVLAGLPVHSWKMLALGTGPQCPPSMGLPDPGSGIPGEDGHIPMAAQAGVGWVVLGKLGLAGAGVGGKARGGAARKRHHMGRKCQHAARSHLGGSAHAGAFREE